MVTIETPYEVFLKNFSEGIHQLFHKEADINKLSLNRGLPAEIWDKILSLKPFSAAIPKEFGGRGGNVREALGVFSAAAYESLALSLSCGINMGLFLGPFGKYAQEDVKSRVYRDFMENNAMGGLMITEPDYGSDALNMRTSFVEIKEGFHIKGEKHWQGLTGLADYWIVVARKKNQNNSLTRDLSFFLVDNQGENPKIKVDNFFNNLGLYMIPYGLNLVDAQVPDNQELNSGKKSGLKMMLDILHRSRLQFPGMGVGFIQRMLDESLSYTKSRMVNKAPLCHLDSVRFQLSRIQAAFTLASGMCAKSAEISGLENDLAGEGVQANTMKALVADLMQESANICVQLAGSGGYKMEHPGARGFLDSRPFQIFEGPNEMLYSQISAGILKIMKLKKENNLFNFMKEYNLTEKIADRFKNLLNFDIPDNLVQRQSVVIGKIFARLISLQYAQSITEKGFRKDLYENAVNHMVMDIKQLATNIREFNKSEPISDYKSDSDWMLFT